MNIQADECRAEIGILKAIGFIQAILIWLVFSLLVGITFSYGSAKRSSKLTIKEAIVNAL